MAVHLRAADLLRSSLQLLRYRVRILRREKADTERDCRCSSGVSLSAGRNHRRRAFAAEERIAADVDLVRCRTHSPARNQRRALYLESRSARPSDQVYKNGG